LSAFYLEHRMSEDLDFFSSEKVPFYLRERFLQTLRKVHVISLAKPFDRNIFILGLNEGGLLKVEFTYFPLKNIEATCLVDGLAMDGILDIVVNKLCAIADRGEPKDDVDLYWAMKSSAQVMLH